MTKENEMEWKTGDRAYIEVEVLRPADESGLVPCRTVHGEVFVAQLPRDLGIVLSHERLGHVIAETLVFMESPSFDDWELAHVRTVAEKVVDAVIEARP